MSHYNRITKSVNGSEVVKVKDMKIEGFHISYFAFALVNILATDPVFSLPPPTVARKPRILFSFPINDTCGSRLETPKILGFDCLINVKCLILGKKLHYLGNKIEKSKSGRNIDQCAFEKLSSV